MSNAISVKAIDALLPQTQCGKCGHPGCLPYAQGITQGEAINKCPPGGDTTVRALARLLQVPEIPLELPAVPPQIALIREAECIGCTKCIQACPVDAILGAAKLMHTVITAECTGCELCVAPCPVDCIDILPLNGQEAEDQRQRADQFRSRHEAHQARLANEAARRQAERAARAVPVASNASNTRAQVQATQTPATTQSTADAQARERHKRLKIEAAMAKVALAKAEKQLASHGTTELQRQVDSLRQSAEQAQRALDAAQVPATAGEAALKQAKIALAMRRTELGKAERLGLSDAELLRLRQALADAERNLHHAEDASGKAPPDLVRTDKKPVDTLLREMKTELAYARAALQRLERRQPVDAALLQQARQRLADIEQRLHDYQPG